MNLDEVGQDSIACYDVTCCCSATWIFRHIFAAVSFLRILFAFRVVFTFIVQVFHRRHRAKKLPPAPYLLILDHSGSRWSLVTAWGI